MGQWGDLLLHIFDPGPWIQLLQCLKVRLVIRWKKGPLFFDAKGDEKQVWQIGRGKQYGAPTPIHDVQPGEKMPCAIWWAPIRQAAYAYQLYLVPRSRQEYWVTNEQVRTEEPAWEIVFASKRRWQIELSFRSGNCELAMESPRRWAFENRLKRLGMVTLVSAFLLHFFNPVDQELLQPVLRLKCHRTGKRCREVLAPLYRLRWAISRLWDDYHPTLGSIFPPHLETLQVLASFSCSKGFAKIRDDS